MSSVLSTEKLSVGLPTLHDSSELLGVKNEEMKNVSSGVCTMLDLMLPRKRANVELIQFLMHEMKLGILIERFVRMAGVFTRKIQFSLNAMC